MADQDPRLLEQKAYTSLSQERFYEAFTLYQKAANIYKSQKNHNQAALCFASAASCWSKKFGEKTFYNAALSYESAASEAEKSKDLEYASLLYKYAAINYERDREFINFSDCFYRSKECYRRFLTYRLTNPAKIHPIAKSKKEKGIKLFCNRPFQKISESLDYGERAAEIFINFKRAFEFRVKPGSGNLSEGATPGSIR